MSIGEYYTSPKEVNEELTERSSLMGEVHRYWELEVPSMPRWCRQIGHFACLARQIPTFRYEDAFFAMATRELHLQPVWIGYEQDWFSSDSPIKRSYLHPKVARRLGKNGQPVVRTEKWCNIEDWVGRRLSEILTKRGDSLVRLHHTILRESYPGAKIFDISSFLRQYMGPREYYQPWLSMFIAHGILFEDYHGGESGDRLDSFTAEVFEPAAEGLRNRFGVYPMITPMPWYSHFGVYPQGKLLPNCFQAETLNGWRLF